MKALSKPLSSPGRADKFPPPLMRFLRSNVGSRSRGRSRSSPLFYLRSRKSSVPIETTQEPSSPKVTCIGQVRVRRAAKSKARGATAAAAATKRRSRGCWWVKKPLFCGRISSRFHRPKSLFRRLFCKCCLVFRFKVGPKEDSFRVHSDKNRERSNENIVAGNNTNDFGGNAGENDCNKKEFTESACACPPPKNALILTRCRSAPYRSSSLAGRFWGSPLAETKEDNEAGNEVELQELEEPRISGESSNNSMKRDDELKGSNGEGAMHPLVLTRCKSVPARAGERLLQESNFSRLTS